jgi:hypothetical protein
MARMRRMSFSGVEGIAREHGPFRRGRVALSPPVRATQSPLTMRAVRLAYSVDTLREDHRELREDIIGALERTKNAMQHHTDAIISAVTIIQAGANAVATRDRIVSHALHACHR